MTEKEEGCVGRGFFYAGIRASCKFVELETLFERSMCIYLCSSDSATATATATAAPRMALSCAASRRIGEEVDGWLCLASWSR